jgi:thymidylate synthase
MRHNYVHANVNDALPVLLHDLLALGDEVGSRAGRTKELMHVGITLADPLRREILVKHRKPNLAAQIAESVWVLAGKNDIGWLEHYLPRAKEFSDDGLTWRAGYGPRLRDWTVDNPEGTHVDQLAYVINTLRESPASRQVVMSIWDPTVDTTPGKDIPCNNWLSWSSRLGKLDLHVAIRSNDVIWGWSGINQFEWSVLLEVVAGILGLQVGQLHFSVTSFHIYDRHWDKAQKIVEASGPTQWWNGLNRSPRFDITGCKDNSVEQLDALLADWLVLEKQIRHGHMSERQVDSFREPMLQSWLRVLQWWWSGEVEYLAPLEGTALETAARDYSVQPPEREKTVLLADDVPVLTRFASEFGGTVTTSFLDEVIQLHVEKDAAYGDSWKKRGEMVAILANIARKVDRLGGSETKDETSADTAIDLFVYLCKYHPWLHEQTCTAFDCSIDSDDTQWAHAVMRDIEVRVQGGGQPTDSKGREVDWIKEKFENLTRAAEHQVARTAIVEDMAAVAYVLASSLWYAENEDEYRGADVD